MNDTESQKSVKYPYWCTWHQKGRIAYFKKSLFSFRKKDAVTLIASMQPTTKFYKYLMYVSHGFAYTIWISNFKMSFVWLGLIKQVVKFAQN